MKGLMIKNKTNTRTKNKRRVWRGSPRQAVGT